MWIFVHHVGRLRSRKKKILCLHFNDQPRCSPVLHSPLTHSQFCNVYSLYTMSSKRSSVVWQLAKIDEDNTEVVWCLIKDRDECNKPIRRGGNNPRNYSTSIVRRHFVRHHPKELAKAEKELQEEK